MEVNSVAIVVTQKLNDMLADKRSIIAQKAIFDQLNEIKNDLEKLRGEYKTGNEDYLEFLYYVEDAVESFTLSISVSRKRLGFLMKHALFLKNLKAYKKLRSEIGKMKKKIKDLEDKKRNVQDSSLSVDSVTDLPENTRSRFDEGTASRTSKRRLKHMSPSRSDASPRVRFREDQKAVNRSSSEITLNRRLWSRLSSSYSYKAVELGLVGFGKHIDDLIGQLTEEDHQIISLVGEKGSGKTTLARAIRATKIVKDYFDFDSSFVWVTIDVDSTAEEILLNLLKQVDSSTDQDCIHNRYSLIDRLNERLKEKKFWIVLDNLQETDTWGAIKYAFLGINTDTKIIITTWYNEVAESARSSLLKLERLTDEDALYLFKLKAASECPEDLKPKVLRICKGLPLNVVLVGSLLSKKDPAKWQTEMDNQDWQKSDVLAMSYNDLSDEEKLCLLYMVLFPKEYDIPVRRLLRLWLAEGFIKPPEVDPSSENRVFPEDRADECFESLFQRSLILITNQRSDGDHRKCRLLGALHEYLFSKAIEIKLFHVHRKMDCPSHEVSLGARRLVEFVPFVAKNCSFSSASKLKYWRSYLSFNFQKKDIPATEVGVLLSNMLKGGFSLLRVLDLEGVYKPSLPDNLGNFFQLRYLGLRWTFLDHLPSSVGNLTYLETLDLKHTNVNSLPASFWKLDNLRHLNLNDIRLDLPVNSNYSFEGLLTLCGLSIVDGECRVKDGLARLSHLRELDLTFQLQDCGELLDWISNSTCLEQLRLRSKNDEGRASTLSLKPLTKLTKLSHMNLFGKMPKLLGHDEFPQNLKVLTFSVSELQSDPMPTLGQLKHLTVLRLLRNSYLGTKISCPHNGFKELRVLKLWMLSNLEDWELGDSCMEKLNELSIRCCNKLKSAPEKLLRQSSFKELILNNMSEEFKNQAEASHHSHVSVIVKNYNFTPLPWEEQEDDSSEVPHSEATTHVNGNAASDSE